MSQNFYQQYKSLFFEDEDLQNYDNLIDRVREFGRTKQSFYPADECNLSIDEITHDLERMRNSASRRESPDVEHLENSKSTVLTHRKKKFSINTPQPISRKLPPLNQMTRSKLGSAVPFISAMNPFQTNEHYKYEKNRNTYFLGNQYKSPLFRD